MNEKRNLSTIRPALLVLATVMLALTSRFLFAQGREDILPIEIVPDVQNLASSFAFTPDGTRLVVGAYDSVYLRDVATGRLLRKLVGHSSWVRAVAFSPNGNEVISGGEDKKLRFWEAATVIGPHWVVQAQC